MRKIIRSVCPQCQRPIETSEEIVRAGFDCPDCGFQFPPCTEPLPEPTTAPKKACWIIHPRRRQYSDPRDQARIVSIVCQCFFVLMAICIIAACVGQELNRWLCISAAAGCLMIYLLGQIVAQLLLIRATLEESNGFEIEMPDQLERSNR